MEVAYLLLGDILQPYKLYNPSMASNVYTQFTADGKSGLMRRSKKQGRPAQGLTRWNGRILSDDLKVLQEKAKELHPYITVNSMIQDAVHNYVCTKLFKT